MAEIHAQRPLVSKGVYSVKNDEWLQEPKQEDIPEVDKSAVEAEFNKLEAKYNDLVKQVTEVESEAQEDVLDVFEEPDGEEIPDDEYDNEDEEVDEIKISKELIKDAPAEKQCEDKNCCDYLAHSVIDALIEDEWSAIGGYSKAAKELCDIDFGRFGDVIDLLNDINDEEQVHVGELATALEKIDNKVKEKIAEGEFEGSDKLDGNKKEV